MEPPSAMVAETNTLVCCSESNEIYCTVCPSGLRLRDWKKHILDPTHLRAIEQFNLIFERTNGEVHCGLCDANFTWYDLRNHAKNHMILPWHKSAKEYDKYEILFDNRIIEWKNNFRCCVCNLTFSDWNIVFVHTTDANHRKLCEEESTPIYEFPSEISYEFLVTEGITAHNEISLDCQICRVKVAVSSVGKHAKGLMHRGNKSKFRIELEECKVNEIGDEFIRRVSVESIGTIVSDFLTNQQEIETDFSMQTQTETDFPMQTQTETDFPMKKQTETDFSMKQQTEIDFSSKNIAIEVDRNQTIQADNSPVKRSNESEISPNKQMIDRENLSYLYIEKRDEIDSFCVICNCVMFHHSVKNHIKDKDHIDAEKEYGCSRISSTIDNQYSCKMCDRQLTGPAVVRSHVTGSKHLKTLHTSMQNRLQMNSKNDEIGKRSEVEKKENSTINNVITTMNGYYYCKVCTINLTGAENIYEHIRGRKHLYKLSKKSIQTCPDRIDGVERFDEVTDRSVDRSINPNDNNNVYEEISNEYDKVHQPDEDENLSREPQLPVQQTREEYSDNFKQPENKKFRWQMNNFEILRRPHINPIKDKHLLVSLNKLKKPEVQQNAENSKKMFVNDRFFNDYLVKENERDYRCEICDRIIVGSEENINIHLTGSLHMESLKNFGCDYILLKNSNIYYCECCDLAITNRHDLYLHIKKNSHANFVIKSRVDSNSKSVGEEKNVGKNENLLTDKNSQASPMVYISRESDEVSNCKICDIELYSYEEIQQHISSNDHVAAMTEYGCNRILHQGGDYYYCVCCECNITGPSCVRTHVRGRRHHFGLRNLLDTEEVKRVKRNINALKVSEGQEANETLGVINDELSKLLDQNRLRETKNRRRRTNVE